jgi:hypothetical protein
MAGCHAYETWYTKSETRPLGYPPVDYKEAGEYVNEETGVRELKYIVNLMVGEIFCRWEGCCHTIRYARTTGLSQHYRDKHQCVAPPLAPGKKTQGGRHSLDKVARSFDFYDAWRAACAEAIREEDAKTEMANNSKAYMVTGNKTNETTVRLNPKETAVAIRVRAKSKDVRQEQPVDKEPSRAEPHATDTSARQTRQQKRRRSVTSKRHNEGQNSHR